MRGVSPVQIDAKKGEEGDVLSKLVRSRLTLRMAGTPATTNSGRAWKKLRILQSRDRERNQVSSRCKWDIGPEVLRHARQPLTR